MVRLFIFLGILLCIDLYAFQAVRSWGSPYSPGTRRIINGVYWGVSVVAYALLALSILDVTEGWSKGAQTFLRVFLFLNWLSKLPIVLILGIDDLRRLVTAIMNWVSPVTERDLSRSRFMSTLALIAGGVPLTTLTYGIVRNAYRYRRFAMDVPVEGLPAALDGLKVVQISDMHSGSWTQKEPLKEAVKMINAEQPDIVCFTGDIVNNEATEMLPYIDIFKAVKGKYGVYSILGNHDYADYVQWPSEAAKQENMELLYDVHRQLGWDLLRDENRTLEVNGHRVGVIGVENWSAAMRFPKKGDLDKAYRGSEDCDCKILLSHDPTHWDAQVRPNYPDIDLTLSGHTHGFQFGVEIPGFRWSPAQYIYKQWAGLYKQGRQHLYVNRGLGFLGYPGRVGILPEITVLTLKTA
ncbi:metallophosphoesterase [Lewinella sp. W8]|uniref:metallophosphoesterase n=1 Tax=Lewinella sp. W8 TaxID=2528208 RepID=UPI0010682F68|nr:metallophosphoesterase [Lewinella sp. W8]MTB52854.1 metallophosphoesterase [Lewinella sp. W8]